MVIATRQRGLSQAEARLGERRVPVRLQPLQHRLLDEAIEHRRDAEGANTPGRLRYLHAPHRLRPVGADKQLGLDLELLQDDATLSIAQFAERVGLSQSLPSSRAPPPVRRGSSSRRNLEFAAHSPLEGDGFEPSIPHWIGPLAEPD
jgi:hypothetical protein